jgi:hypothetical protein
MNARSITTPLRFRRDAFVAVDPERGASQVETAECLARLPARPPDNPGVGLTSEEKWILARDAAVLCASAMAALALVLFIFERAYA